MTVTENNYEEYFLLYVDDELNHAERSAVEAFVQQHPQYAAVLNLLLQTKLSDSVSLSFESKETLYKQANSEIGIDNYEEYFLLYTDNELTETERLHTERFVLQHPQLQPLFLLLQQTKLSPEKIEFADKEILFKKEKQRRVLPLFITRFAIAAVFVGMIFSAWFLLPANKNNSKADTVNIVHNKKQTREPVEPVVLPQKKTISSTQVMVREAQKNGAKNKEIPIEKTENKSLGIQDVAQVEPDINKPQTLPEPEQTQAQQQPVADINNEVTKESTLKPLAEVTDEEATAQTALSVSDNNNIVQPAVYKELNTNDDNRTLYVGAFQLNKTKVNGFLKSASRLLGKGKQSGE